MTLSTHILDTTLGRPAAEVRLRLERMEAGQPTTQQMAVTDADGRCRFPAEAVLAAGVYRLHFETLPYFLAQGARPLHPYVEITFFVDAQPGHLHIPLLVTANGYTTYRGS